MTIDIDETGGGVRFPSLFLSETSRKGHLYSSPEAEDSCRGFFLQSVGVYNSSKLPSFLPLKQHMNLFSFGGGLSEIRLLWFFCLLAGPFLDEALSIPVCVRVFACTRQVKNCVLADF